jgi:hypothetical protein
VLLSPTIATSGCAGVASGCTSSSRFDGGAPRRDAGSLLAVDHMYFEALKWSLGMTEADVTPRHKS